MKKAFQIIITMILAVIMNSCAIVQKPYVSYDKNSAETVKDKYEIYQAIQSYPSLKHYYDEGVISIVSVKKVKAIYLNNSEYIIKYRYCKNYITDYSEQMTILKEDFPEIYNLYCIGKINLVEMYKYVGENQNVQTHISYNYR